MSYVTASGCNVTTIETLTMAAGGTAADESDLLLSVTGTAD